MEAVHPDQASRVRPELADERGRERGLAAARGAGDPEDAAVALAGQRACPLHELAERRSGQPSTPASSSDRCGGEAPGRSQVRAAIRQANSVAAATVSRSERSSRPSPRACHQATKPPPNASPAPIVSTTFVRGDGTATSAFDRDDERAAGPAGQQPDGRAAGQQLSHGVHGAASGREPVEVLLADLEHVALREHAREPLPVGPRVGDDVGPDVRVDEDHRVAREPHDDGLQRRRGRLQHEAERAGVHDLHLVGAGRERRLRRQACSGGALRVEAVARDAELVDVGQRERGRLVGVDDRVEPDAVLCEQRLQALTEAIAREPAEVGHGALQPSDRPGGVERAAAGVGGERVDRLRGGDQVDQRFACDEDHSGHGRARYMRVVENRVMSVLDAFRLDGRVAVVTGGNRGLGFAFARALGEAGARVAIAARDAGKNVEAAAALDALGVELDVTDPTSVAAMVERVTEELGPIDVLVNNAGACFHRPALEVPEEEWRAVWDVNVDGLWHCSRVVGAQMVERRAGVIVNIGSISAMIVNRPQMQPAYNASKAAVHQLTRSLAAEWAPLRHPCQRARARLHEDRDGPGRRAALPSPLDRGRTDGALRDT